MLVSQKALDALKGIGLNLYERRLWVSLLARGNSTAGELSEIANVPRSRAYDILQSLSDKGFVVVQNAKPLRYVAMSPDEALDRARNKMREEIELTQQRIEELKTSPVMKELNDVFSKGLKVITPEDMTGSLKGKYSVLQQLDSMFKGASERIHILTNADGLKEIHEKHIDTLRKAKEKGVAIRIATSNHDKNSDAIKALSGVAEVRHMDEKAHPSTGRFCVVDGKEMVMSLTDSKSTHATQDMAIWSKSEHAAGKVMEPIFNMIWESSRPALKVE
jgi:sugar-specific transcriptional regulator TrmB